MRKQITFIFACLIALFSATAQQKKYNFSLEEAIQFALDSSYTALNSRKEVAKALKKKWETTADGLPQINGSIEYLNQLEQQTSVFPASTFNPSAPADQVIAAPFGLPQSVTASATITQLIFDGSYLVGLEAASVFVDFTQTQKEKDDLAIIEGVTNAYGSVLVSKESIAVVEKNLTTIEKNLSDTKITFENGLIEEESVEQLQITKLQLKNQLNNLKHVNEIAAKMFNLSVGIPIEKEVHLTDSLENLAIKKETSSLTANTFNLNNNNDFKLSELLVEQRRLEWKLERKRKLPSIGAFFNAGTQAFDFDFDFLDSDKRWYGFYNIGGKISLPIFSSFKDSARKKQAKLAYQQAQTSLDENSQRIQLAYSQAKNSFDFSIDNLNTLKENLALAERIEKKNQIKFTEGLATSFELRQAQTQLYSAQQEYLNAQLSLIQNAAKLQTILNVQK